MVCKSSCIAAFRKQLFIDTFYRFDLLRFKPHSCLRLSWSLRWRFNCWEQQNDFVVASVEVQLLGATNDFVVSSVEVQLLGATNDFVVSSVEVQLL